MKRKLNYNYIYYFWGIFLIFILWFFIAEFVKYSFVFPKIIDVFIELKNILSKLNTYLLILKLLLSLIISITTSFFISFLLASISYLYKGFKNTISPFITLLKVLPSITILLYLKIVFYNYLLIIPYLLTYLMIIPILYEGLIELFNQIDPDLIMDIKLNAKISLLIIFKYFLKIKQLSVISILLQVVSLGLKIFIMSQIITGIINSIGYNIFTASSYFETSIVFAWTLILVFLGLVIDLILKVIKQIIIKGEYNE